MKILISSLAFFLTFTINADTIRLSSLDCSLFGKLKAKIYRLDGSAARFNGRTFKTRRMGRRNCRRMVRRIRSLESNTFRANVRVSRSTVIKTAADSTKNAVAERPGYRGGRGHGGHGMRRGGHHGGRHGGHRMGRRDSGGGADRCSVYRVRTARVRIPSLGITFKKSISRRLRSRSIFCF